MAALIPHRQTRLPFLLLAFLAALAGCGEQALPSPSPSSSTSHRAATLVVDSSVLLQAARDGADFLLLNQGEDGGLAFRIRPDVAGLGEGQREPHDNDLHQAGACLALVQVYRQTGEPRYLAGAEAGLGLLLRQTRGPRPADEEAGFRAIVSEDVGTVGASALTLLALLEHRAATGSQRWSEAMEGLARFLAFQEQSDGKIVARYLYGPSRGGPFEAPYGASTAALALLRYSRIDPRGVLSSWFNDAERGAGWLMAVRDLGKTYDELPHDFRLLQTLDELHELSGGGRTYYLHARRVAQGILEALEEEKAKAPQGSPQALARAAAMVSVIRIAHREKVSTAIYEAALDEMLDRVLGWELLRGDDAADAVSLFLGARGVLALATPEAPG